MDLDNLTDFWNNPKKIDLDLKFIYYILINDNEGNVYNYIGKARNKKRLKEYTRNLKKIHKGKERGKNQNYRAVHFALFTALENNWKVKFHPIENCLEDKINEIEKEQINKFKCNLNGAKTWRISKMPSTIDDLL